ncbi:uncharacterized protein LOC142351043 [Convolutriloba macropyga]|uniref:uncharacterized protein LOC142351043 n=1 Tax=Convolutriloba macropyga TaxID=536237 RepID=UPI003F5285DD
MSNTSSGNRRFPPARRFRHWPPPKDLVENPPVDCNSQDRCLRMEMLEEKKAKIPNIGTPFLLATALFLLCYIYSLHISSNLYYNMALSLLFVLLYIGLFYNLSYFYAFSKIV